jgi:formylglycine-generating enzyme required for sulfatase activity
MRRPVRFAPRAAAPGNTRKRRWLRVAIGLGLLAVVGYLAYTGHLGSASYWRRTTAPLRNWLWPQPAVEKEDPEEQAIPALNNRTPPASGPAGMAWVPGGWFWRGSDIELFPDAAPMRKIYVDSFWMDVKHVTNRQFKAFVDETGYRTVAEQQPSLRDFPQLQPERLGFKDFYLHALAVAPGMGFPSTVSWAGLFHTWPAIPPCAAVFTPPTGPLDEKDVQMHRAWWQLVPGACWHHPQGPDRPGIAGLEDHPVVQITWPDAVAYCEWRSKKDGKKFRLPTEAEWEFAARGGLDRKLFAWGDDLKRNGKWMCNVWQGDFPFSNDKEDGFEGTSPVGSFPPNGYGLYDMAGNVWQWCADWYHYDYFKDCPNRNPPGPSESLDPAEVGVRKRVQRGGSFLCCDNYCVRYVVGARGKGEPRSPANNVGFRCVCEP